MNQINRREALKLFAGAAGIGALDNVGPNNLQQEETFEEKQQKYIDGCTGMGLRTQREIDGCETAADNLNDQRPVEDTSSDSGDALGECLKGLGLSITTPALLVGGVVLLSKKLRSRTQ